MNETQRFTEGKIFSPLIRFAAPGLLALFLQAMYGAVDILIVGRFGGESADVFVSAVSTGSQILMTLTVVITGLATPVSSAVQILLCVGFFLVTQRGRRKGIHK